MKRDNFNEPTKRRIALRVGYVCSNPNCRSPTVGAARGDDGVVNVGVAAHITAAALGGPRFDPSLTTAERRSQHNGIWLCQTDAKAVDSDKPFFTVELLKKWKLDAEQATLPHIFQAGPPVAAQSVSTESVDAELIQHLGLNANDTLSSITTGILRAAQNDLETFKTGPEWPTHPVALSLRLIERDDTRVFNVSQLAAAMEAFNEITVIAPPGTGKTTTLLQLASALVEHHEMTAVFIPLSEWSSLPQSLLAAVANRQAFVGFREEHFKLLAHFGRLVLFLDGWNELDAHSRRRLTAELRTLQRQYPDLAIILSTRRQALDVPIEGPVVEIDALSEEQQQELAHGLSGRAGEALLDHAWRTPGVRELVTIPLYLTALLGQTPGRKFPTTREEVLRLFVDEHERVPEKAEALRAGTLGFHSEMLQALAADATGTANTSISDSRARSVVRQVEEALLADGQITIAPQPADILDTLVSQHTLTRTGGPVAALSFQHQQFQEWYASFEAERLMIAAASGDADARRSLGRDLLNLPTWEEAILFASERLSRADVQSVEAVSAAVLHAMEIDPMLAAEMIYRSSPLVWEMIKSSILGFCTRWHVPGRLDRAIGFMVRTGRTEFAGDLWLALTDPDEQVMFGALRSAPTFRTSVLGDQIAKRIQALSESRREHVLAEIARLGGVDGLDLATKLAKLDPSPSVQVEVVQSLAFRRADRWVAKVLSSATDEVWKAIARKGYPDESTVPEVAARLLRERKVLLDSEIDPLSKVRTLLQRDRSDPQTGAQVGALLDDVCERADRFGEILYEAHEAYPADVVDALIRRLGRGHELPYRAEDYLRSSAVQFDDGPLAAKVLDPATPAKVAMSAACVIGPITVGKLLDELVTFNANWKAERHRDKVRADRYQRVRDLVRNSRFSVFTEALLVRESSKDPNEIALLADLFARHGHDDEARTRLPDATVYPRVVQAIKGWGEVLLASPTATRGDLHEIAGAIERLATAQLLPLLQQMLLTDLSEYRRQREEGAQARAQGRQPSPYSYTSYATSYQSAFAALGTASAEFMMSQLRDPVFGPEAAFVLKEIELKLDPAPPRNPFFGGVDFSVVRQRRLELTANPATSDSIYATAIFRAIAELMRADATDKELDLALVLGRVGFSLRHTCHSDIRDRLMSLPDRRRLKQGLVTALVLSGEVVTSDAVLAGMKQLLSDAQTQPWLIGADSHELYEWLALLPFTDRPLATLEGLGLLPIERRDSWRLRSVLSALGHAPSDEAEEVLISMAETDPAFLREHEWLEAFEKRGTVTASRHLLEYVVAGKLGGGRTGGDSWTMTKKLAAAIDRSADFRAEVYQRYQQISDGSPKAVLAKAIAEVADITGVLTLVREYGRRTKAFDGTLSAALRHVALTQRPVAWGNMLEIIPVPIADLRKELLKISATYEPLTADVARACLIEIDEIRDDYGSAGAEPRHPDIESGLPWPLPILA